MPPLRFGVLGVAKIAREKVIPAMQRSALCDVVGLASRDGARASEAATSLGIPKAYGSYDALLEDPDIEAVYIPLPNHLHVPWAARAAEAGKHVLCEKPLALNAAGARELLAVRDRTGVVVEEAFMIRTHPQWLETLARVRRGDIGEVRLVVGHFSYFERDPADIRSRPEWGGGALMDIGCYLVHAPRWLLGAEPERVRAVMQRDPELGVDRLTSAILEFADAQAVLTCATQLAPGQRVEVWGERGRIEIEIPFNAPNDRACRIHVQDAHGDVASVELPVVDQYTLQGDAFARAVRGKAELPVPLEDSVRNMAVMDAIVRAAESGRWEAVEGEG